MKDDILTFKRWEQSDIDNLVKAIHVTPNLNQWVPWAKPDYTHEDGKKWVDICQNTWHKFRCYAVYKDDSLVGSVSSSQINIHTSEIGYWVAAPFRRQGICTRMIKAAIDYSFHTMHSQYVIFKIGEENIISQHSAEKVGAVKIGNDTLYYVDRIIPAFIYQIERNND